MKYFQTLPNISQTDFSGNQISVTNILARGYLLDSLQKNLYLYYDYTLKESDKPEIISYKFYNDQYRYWMIMYANNIFDVAPPYFWTDCDDNVKQDKFYYNTITQEIKPMPEDDLPPHYPNPENIVGQIPSSNV